MKKYIAVDTSNDTTKERIIMSNDGNVVSGTLKTKENDDDATAKDIRDIFIKKSDLDELEDIEDPDSGDFTLIQVARLYHELLGKLRGTATIVVAMLCLGLIGGQNDGKAQLGTIKANQFVVINEVDSVFNEWKSNEFNTFSNDLNEWKSGVSSWQT